MKIYHGPCNIAGIGRYCADYQRKKGYVSDFIVQSADSPICEKSHYCLYIEKYKFRLERFAIIFSNFLSCLIKYDLFNFYFGYSLLPHNLDLPILKLFGKKIVMTYCGSDIRLIEVERKRNPYWHLLRIGLNHPKYDPRKKMMMRWQNLWIDRFIAPRNLYASAIKIIPPKKVEEKLWIHNSMDLNNSYCPNFKTKHIPTLVHAPSETGIKGTKYVERAVENLRGKGIQFNYLRIEKVPHDEAQRIYRDEADIVIDQFFLGGFGTLAVEGMYYGKPVCGYLITEVKKEHFPDYPMVNCTIDNLEEKLAWLVKNPQERVKIGRAGRKFVEKYFDREKLNENLLELYSSLY